MLSKGQVLSLLSYTDAASSQRVAWPDIFCVCHPKCFLLLFLLFFIIAMVILLSRCDFIHQEVTV